jgi:hypothetical protein
MRHDHAVCGGARRLWPGLVFGVMCLPGCVEPLRGSNVQMDLSEGVPAVADRGATANPGQAPADTFFTLYAADYEYVDADGDGRADLDLNGEPLIAEAFLFEVQRFEIKKLIDTTSPCFIDLPGGAGTVGRNYFPGIHITQHARRVREAVGLGPTDSALDPSIPYDDAVLVLTADRRATLLPRLEGELKAVTSSDATVEAGRPDFEYPDTTAAGECGGSTALIPHPTCTDDESNAHRLAMCQQLWAEAGPSWYEGSDKVFTLPMNGIFYGLVEGMNPVNDVGVVGGAGFYVDENLVGHDAFLIRYQWKDFDGDGMPDVPAGETFDIVGKPYLSARSEHFSRGVTSGTFRHATEGTVRGELAVFPDLGDDDVQF